ncbi:MAG: AAA family ATPase [Vicinamibacterales bacterium]
MDDQTRVIEFLAHGGPDAGAAMERIDTHTAIVFLCGHRAWKMKRAVRYDYLDFSTPDRRRAACEAELRLNRRTAPQIYVGVSAVTEETGDGLSLDGRGRPLEWLVVMHRFDEQFLLDRLATRGALTLALMPPLADAVADLHEAARPRPDHGGVDGMRWVVEGNAADFERFKADLPAGDADAVTAGSRQAITEHARLLEARRTAGVVRECHGDLHLRNVVLLDGRPVLFDGIEFNDRIACVDVLYDAAFLLMDLLRRHLPVHANRLFNRYLARTTDEAGLALLPLFLSCRAAVRAKTSATAAGLQDTEAAAAALRRAARDYLAQAAALLAPQPARVIAIGGLSGTGKSALALRLAPGLGRAPGALVLRSDEVRKALLGRALHERLGPEGYTPEVSERVYASIATRTRLAAAAGHSVIVDAVHADPASRAGVEAAARSAGVPFAGLWLEAPAATARARLAARRGDVSDATPAVLDWQREQQTGPIDWPRVDAAGTADLTERLAHEALGT